MLVKTKQEYEIHVKDLAETLANAPPKEFADFWRRLYDALKTKEYFEDGKIYERLGDEILAGVGTYEAFQKLHAYIHYQGLMLKDRI